MIREEEKTESFQAQQIPVFSKRVIFDVQGKAKGPILLFVGSMHGNEPAGSIALQKVAESLPSKKLKGRALGIVGNLKALIQKKRFIQEDLNRIWIPENLQKVNGANFQPGVSAELDEMAEINAIIDAILHQNNQQLYFIDLHTTSAATVPFITMNDSLNNRAFCQKFALPIVLGIEEVLEGPMLSYINDLGYVALAFEAGSHKDQNSILHHEAFIWMCLVYAGLLNKKNVTNFKSYQQLLTKTKEKKSKFFEVLFRYAIQPNDGFKMQPGYSNFQPLAKNQIIATNNKGNVVSDRKANIFMPLYQKQGSDGFFMIRPLNVFWLNLSKYLRILNFNIVLSLLPGVKKSNFSYDSLEVNLKVAKFLTNQVFHLLGYRKKSMKNNKAVFTKRDFSPRKKV